jgi:DNA-binding NarL/FixJ family response regulator
MCPSTRPRVVIADDHLPMLATLARLVGIDCDVIGTVTDGEALVRETRRLQPDLVVVDIFMPVMDGFAAGRQVKLEFPHIQLIYVTLDPEPRLNAEAIRIGAFALVSKESAVTQLPDAIRRAMADPRAL